MPGSFFGIVNSVEFNLQVLLSVACLVAAENNKPCSARGWGKLLIHWAITSLVLYSVSLGMYFALINTMFSGILQLVSSVIVSHRLYCSTALGIIYSKGHMMN